ncbi:hypothetical protein Kisp01_19540 [Kineosporia sp. NBRC 101677]|uniref:hypothetical protein n=1 Tax=Kineosporia sp. NBRC 101677 TaxID=3032197 RepID=UPI0024A35506|nr:hypothetical protein [Kineosporia sp. NBRC 101677]GLY14939.1 hypothetical protein Kisp01_19540 [Kineosporia sp. NBRC 101677]
MIKRTVMVGLATTALASTSLLLAGPAQAAKNVESCSITDILPDRVVIGTSAERVQFGVRTTCDDQDVKFAVRGAGIGTSAHAFWFAACNYDMLQGPTNFDCTHGGSGVINPIGGTYRGYDFVPGNDLTGPNPIYAGAFVDADHNAKDDDGGGHFELSETITLLRQTRFGDSLDASPEPVRKGKKINLTADLETADWNTGTWEGVDATVQIQFRAVGEKKYRTVETVTATGGKVDTSVVAKRSGDWRAHHPATEATAASTSGSDYVKVKPAR